IPSATLQPHIPRIPYLRLPTAQLEAASATEFRSPHWGSPLERRVAAALDRTLLPRPARLDQVLVDDLEARPVGLRVKIGSGEAICLGWYCNFGCWVGCCGAPALKVEISMKPLLYLKCYFTQESFAP